MLNGTAFARNTDGTIKTKQPCETPGCRYPNFHLCNVPTAPDAELMPRRSVSTETFTEKFQKDPTRRDRVTEGHRTRMAKVSAKANERNQRIAADRKEG